MRVGVCAIVKNEGRYLKEWMSYYLSIGCDHFYVYDNESSDTTAGILEAARRAGVCTSYSWPRKAGEKPQNKAYEHWFTTHSTEVDWILIVDADEFLNLRCGSNVRDLIALRDGADQIAIYWRMFGSSGRQDYQPGLVMERIKWPQVHYCDLQPDSVFTDSEGAAIVNVHAAQPLSNVSYQTAQLNHYFTKSREEWTIKRNRGKADVQEDHQARYRDENDFAVYDRNDEDDTSILRHVVEVKKIMSDLFKSDDDRQFVQRDAGAAQLAREGVGAHQSV
jgi:hypothetical protein